jgi:translation initiation factor IF-1
MTKEEATEVMAKVLETLPNAMFRVELEETQHQVLAPSQARCGSILSGFFQVIECWLLSPYDLNRGRITYRY